MQLLQPFNPMNYDPAQTGGQLPVGKHPVVIDGHDITATKNNDGGMLVFNLSIIDGPLKGGSGVYRLNLYNQSQVACEIAHKQFAAICHVTGMAGTIINDPAQLHGIPFYVEVAPQTKSPEYTEVKKVYDMNGIEPGKPGCGQGIQQQAAPAGFQQPAAPPQAPVQQPAQNAFQQPPSPGGGFGQPAPQAQQQAAPAWPTPEPAAQQQPVQQAPAAAAPWGNQGQAPAQQQAAPVAGGPAPWTK